MKPHKRYAAYLSGLALAPSLPTFATWSEVAAELGCTPREARHAGLVALGKLALLLGERIGKTAVPTSRERVEAARREKRAERRRAMVASRTGPRGRKQQTRK